MLAVVPAGSDRCSAGTGDGTVGAAGALATTVGSAGAGAPDAADVP
jgi:hypothetical protein